MTRHSDLSSPRQVRRVGLHYDQEAFGQFSESIARTLGTARFLVWQTCIVVVWIILNVAFAVLRWDKYPFILLNLAFSTQAAYAAPLILLAQNRQEQRDRVQTDNDRRVAERTQADTEFLAREISSVRVALADMVTTEDMRDHLDRLTVAVERMANRLDDIEMQSEKSTDLRSLDQPRDEAE
ncbi:MAG: putative rane protein [Ilumatobacteraceae bacterium]|nr:putative rane protein [Ilumatobacteraceae bacterium]